MKKVLVCVLLAAVLVICMGMKGIVPVDVDDSGDQEMVTMYSEDGRSEQFTPSEVEEQKTVGWYNNFSDVLTTMWKEDGSSIVVYKADEGKYEREGYTTNYSSIFAKVFNPETEEVKDVLKSEVQTYVDSGWKRGNGKLDPDEPMIALTFDDGPGAKTTPRLLDALEENNARATFFMLGDHMKGSADTIKRMQSLGCDTASHTYDHTQLTSLSGDALKSQFEKSNNNLKDIIGENPSSVRPPYGSYNDTVKSVAKDYGMPIILWSVDTLDWKSKNADAVYNAVMSTVQDGDILLFHDIYDSTIDAVERLIPALMDEGYQLVTVSEMGEAKIGGLEAGHVYTDLRPGTVKSLTGGSQKSSGSSNSERSENSSNSNNSNND